MKVDLKLVRFSIKQLSYSRKLSHKNRPEKQQICIQCMYGTYTDTHTQTQAQTNKQKDLYTRKFHKAYAQCKEQ